MMHPQLRLDLLRDEARRLDRRSRRAVRPDAPTPAVGHLDEAVALRLCTVHDDPALERLAVLDGRRLPAGRFVLAEVSGTVVASVPLRGGPALADPFRPTAHLLPLLRLRARQLGSGQRRLAAARAIARRVLNPAR